MHHFDALDERILRVLEVNADLSNLELAQRVHASNATCLRRVARLRQLGVIQKTVALLDPVALGLPLTAIVEVSLDQQSAERMDAFEKRAAQDRLVRQCYRVASGVDFVLVVYVADMDQYHQFAHRLLSEETNVRNVRVLFSTHCAKFETNRMPSED